MVFRAVLIDWDKTLSKSRFWGHWEQERPITFGEIQVQLFLQRKDLVHEWMRGNLDSEAIANFLQNRLDIPSSELLQHLQQSCEQMTLINPTILETIQTLRSRGTLVAIATDNMDTFLQWTVPALRLQEYFDDMLSSNDLRLLKRDVARDGTLPFFESILQGHHLSPSDCVILDDSNTLGPLAIRNGFHYRQVTPLASASRLLAHL